MLADVLRRFSEVPALMESATKSEPSSGAVVFTGISLVFLILVLLIIILLIEGKIFTAIDNKKKADASKPASGAVAEKPAQAAPVVAPPVVEEGIPPEVIAAIAAAVATIEDGKYTLRSVQTSQKGRGQWGLAGVISHTEPF